jgi:N-acetylmuramoyl-L-alanine amidase
MREIHKIIIHCSDTESGTAAAIRKFHMAPPPDGRGWDDIGYHWVIDLDGNVETGRPEEEEGAHCEGHNLDSIGICLIGVKNFSIVQLLSMRRLVQQKMAQYSVPSSEVFGHYEFDTAIAQGKTCPNILGNVIRAFIQGVV